MIRSNKTDRMGGRIWSRCLMGRCAPAADTRCASTGGTVRSAAGPYGFNSEAGSARCRPKEGGKRPPARSFPLPGDLRPRARFRCPPRPSAGLARWVCIHDQAHSGKGHPPAPAGGRRAMCAPITGQGATTAAGGPPGPKGPGAPRGRGARGRTASAPPRAPPQGRRESPRRSARNNKGGTRARTKNRAGEGPPGDRAQTGGHPRNRARGPPGGPQDPARTDRL